MAAFAPRAPIERKSGTIDISDGYERRMARMRDNLLRQGLSELEQYTEFQEAERYIDYLTGTWWDKNRPKYRSAFYDNYLAEARIAKLSALSDIQPMMDITCRVDAYRKQDEVLQKYLRCLWFEEDLDLTLVSWLDHALFGTGFLKCVAFEPDVSVTSSNFQFTDHGLDFVIPVGMNQKLQGACAVISRAYKPLSYFHRRFGPQRCEGLEREAVAISRNSGGEQYSRPDGIPEYTWQSMGPALRRRASMRMGLSQQRRGSSAEYSPFPVLELQELYVDDPSINEFGESRIIKHPDLDVSEHNFHYSVPPGYPLYPRKRLIVFAGNRVMYDGPNPYWHGQYPFEMLQLNPCVFNPGGISAYRDLVPLVRTFNRMGVGIDEAVMRALNGTWVAKRGHVSEPVWDAFIPGKPGQKLMINPTGDLTSIREMPAPQLPSQVEFWARHIASRIKEREGTIDMQQLARKKQMPSGEAQDAARDTLSGPIRLESRYVEKALKGAARLTVSNVIQFATLTQRLKYLGDDGWTPEDFDYNAATLVPSFTPREDHWKLFSVTLRQGSQHGAARMQRKTEAMVMHQRGALSTEGLYEQTEFPANWDTEKKRIAKEREEGVGPAQQKATAGRTARSTRTQRNGSPL